MGAGDGLPKMGTWILVFIGQKSKQDWRTIDLLGIAPEVMARRQDMTNYSVVEINLDHVQNSDGHYEDHKPVLLGQAKS